MLSFKFITNSSGAQHYFENSDDYYAKEGHKGEWEGNGAEALGLKGGVEGDVFRKLLDGVLPDGEVVRKAAPRRQGNGKQSKPRLGIDFTFSAPKSVSIAALVNGDQKLLKAHDDSVRAALKLLEGMVVARKKEKGLSFRQHTNNFIAATFRHDLSRSQDPQLHTHAVTMNLTQRDDGKWVAITNDEMLKAIKVVGAFYRADLAERVEKLGYEIRNTRHGFELASVSDKAIDLFSKRSKQVVDELKTLGLTRDSAGSQAKQTVTQATRPNKTDADRAELRKEWVGVLKEAGIELRPGSKYEEVISKVVEVANHIGRSITPQKVLDKRDERKRKTKDEIATRAVDFAIEHLMERQGIFTRSELMEHAFMKAIGAHELVAREIEKAKADGRIITELPLYQSAKSFSRDKAEEAKTFNYDKFKHGSETDKLTASSWAALAMADSGISQDQAEKLVKEAIASGRLVSVEERYTTGNMLEMERRVLSLEEQGRGQVAPLMSPEAVREMFAGTKLNEGQLSAVELILTTSNRFVGVQGFAGVGKSFAMSATVNTIKAEAVKQAADQGYKVIGLAPYASQNKALEELGMKSETLASFLIKASEHEKLDAKTLIFLDEASVVPAHQMATLMDLVTLKGARLIELGDIKQTQAVEAGKPFQQLQENGMATAHIREIQRQKDALLKAAVISAANDKVAESVNLLKRHTREIQSDELRYDTIAKEYGKLSAEDRDKTLIVAGTNEARKEINERVREELKLPEGEKIKALDSVDLTRAEAKLASSYQEGHVVVPETGQMQGLSRGQYYDVISVNSEANTLRVVGGDAKVHEINIGEMGAVSVYERTELRLAPGDWIKNTRNNKKEKRVNGDRYQVAKVFPERVVMTNGVSLSRDNPIHARYAYASTVNSAQGQTAQRVLIDANVKSLTSNRSVYYVAISRPTTKLQIFTNDSRKLAESMSREPKKFAALELRNPELERRMQAQAVQRQALRRSMKPKVQEKQVQTRLKFK